jgi:hypothetical protein
MSRSLAALALIPVFAAPALADAGHLLEHGRGHVHWDELLIVAAVAAALIGYGAARLARRWLAARDKHS